MDFGGIESRNVPKCELKGLGPTKKKAKRDAYQQIYDMLNMWMKGELAKLSTNFASGKLLGGVARLMLNFFFFYFWSIL